MLKQATFFMMCSAVVCGGILLGCTNAKEVNEAKSDLAKSALEPATNKSNQDPTKGQKYDVTKLLNANGKSDPSLGNTAGYAARTPDNGADIAILETDAGNIVVRFFPEAAPNHVKNFLDLSRKGFYNGTKFHRVIPGFMIQGGDPNTKTSNVESWGTGDPGYKVKNEFNEIPHVAGILSMARSQDPDSAGSQFFIMHNYNESLNGQYTVFGQVLKGMDVVNKIVTAPRGAMDRPNKPVAIKNVKLTKWPVDLKSIK